MNKQNPDAEANREKIVEEANANLALEGFAPDKEVQAIQARYIAGQATLEDLLQHARRFAPKP